MKRILAVLSVIAVLFSLAVPAFAQETDVVIDSKTASFPADETVSGDLVITGDCPDTVILINVTVTGTLRIEADHEVTVRLQGESSCGALEVNSRALIYGGSFGDVTVNAPYLRFENAQAESMEICRENGVVTLNSKVNHLTVSAPNVFVGGSGRVETAVIDQVGCSLNLFCPDVQKNVTEEEHQPSTSQGASVRASFTINPSVSPASSVVNATVTFTNVPPALEGEYRIYWYIKDTLSYYEWDFYLEEGATSTLQCSVHFDGVMDSRIPVWCLLKSNGSDDTELQFVTSTLVTGYSTAQYDAIEASSRPYMLHLIRNQGVIIVYGLDEKNEYTKIVNVFPCSVGYYKDTALGDFEIGLQMRWGSLMGDVYGQYCSQFNNNQLFHSVPYLSKDVNNIEFWEYEYLGTPASSGCVRLCVADAKWIYDHCWTGTKVKVYDSSVSPVVQPVPCIIREDSLLRGWDPTDPDPDNPTKAKTVPVVRDSTPEAVHPYITFCLN